MQEQVASRSAGRWWAWAFALGLTSMVVGFAITGDDDTAPLPALVPAAPTASSPARAVACATEPTRRMVDLDGHRATAIAAGGERVCALLDDATVMCWGDLAVELGVPAEGERPRRIAGFDDVIELAMDDHTTCARHASGAVTCLGTRAPPLDRMAPARARTHRTLAPTLTGVCASHANGVVCTGDWVGNASAPLSGFSAIQVAASFHTGCAIDDDRRVRCWGVGFNPYGSRVLPVLVPELGRAIQLEVTSSTVCALGAGGKVRCRDADGLVTRIADLDDARLLSRDCAVRSSGKVACWHDGPHRAVDVEVVEEAVDIAVGPGFMCVLDRDGRVRCTGSNRHGQLGLETMNVSHTPAPVCGLERVRTVAVGRSHVCALRDDGDMYCWGSNGEGQLGVVDPVARARPVLVRRGIAQVEITESTTCARDRAGHVDCWGATSRGFIEEQALTTPCTSVESFAVNPTGLCAIERDRTVSCNGVPTGITGATRIITASGAFPCATVPDPDGGERVVCWNTSFAPHAHAQPGGSRCGYVFSGPAPVTSPVALLSCAGQLCGRPLDASSNVVCEDGRFADRCPPWDPRKLDDLAASRSQYNTECKVEPNGLVTCSGDNALGQLGRGLMGNVLW